MLVTMFIENIREEEVSPLDFGGFILTGVGLAGLVFGFEMVGRGVLPVSVVIAIIARRRGMHGALRDARAAHQISRSSI